jgi:protein gp37
MNPAWVKQIRDQCLQFGVAFHFKQWGQWRPDNGAENRPRVEVIGGGGETEFMVRLNKRSAGRVLDGRTWNGLPGAYNT